jgi:outer membrane protein assembly factor BamD
MTHPSTRLGTAAVLAALLVAACGGTRANAVPPGTPPDRFLMDRANAELKDRKWINAREYYRQVVDNYPGSPLRPDAKLGLGDAFLGEGSTESRVLAANEYREFLTFYPTSQRADYAQYKLAMTYFEQMRTARRDQTETEEAVKEFQVFFDRYGATSPLTPEVRQKWRQARDRLSEASFLVGLHYYRIRWDAGAIDRFREVLKVDPEYTHRDDVYFYLAEALARSDRRSEAIPYFDRLLKEFIESEHLIAAKKRLQELTADPPPTTIKN